MNSPKPTTVTQALPLGTLVPHPDNPRTEPRGAIVAALAARMAEVGFDPAHAILVRPLDDVLFEIISGHHRVLAATAAKLDAVPAWVRPMDDAEAYMLLALTNTQSELTALERGRHALAAIDRGVAPDVKAYAAAVGRKRESVRNEVYAAEVASVANVSHGDLPDTSILYFLHAAPEWLWPTLVRRAVEEEWTVARAQKAVEAVKVGADGGVKLELWWNTGKLAETVVSAASLSQIAKAQSEVKAALAALAAEDGGADLMAGAVKRLVAAKPASASAALELAALFMSEKQARMAAAAAAQKTVESSLESIMKLAPACTIEQWKALSTKERETLLTFKGDGDFNRQSNTSIEWAMWLWNPITGCEHGCPYCYARVIATAGQAAHAFPNGFVPTLCASRLSAPKRTKVPVVKTEADWRWRNVFVCSMADLFGRWVPAPWIEEVLARIAGAPEWNFLCLTKFPKRMAEFSIPANMWMGTTVDLQARVPAAEAAFAKIDCGVRWLSVEPMLEPLKFSNLSMFDWIVIGGASPQPATKDSPATPEWFPPFEWIVDLVEQARAANCRVYFKTNLLGSRILELPGGLTIPQDAQAAPPVFQYLKKVKQA